MTVVLRAEKISKIYGSTPALKGVDFEVHSGAVNVLIGENGAGKSTLMKILAGVESPTSGALYFDGKSIRLASVKEAAAVGISIVHQELNLCPNLSVAENIFLSRHLLTAGVIDRARERKAAASLMLRLEQDIDPDTAVGNLRIGAQQIVEIARALADEARVLILDEPTSALSQTEVDVLFRIIEELKKAGVAIIYISHRLEELMAIGDYITVLRDGQLVATAPIAETSLDWIIRHMLGRDGQDAGQASHKPAGEMILSVRDVDLDRPAGGWLLKGASLDFYKGQITGIYGLLGAGRTEFLEVLAGQRRPSSGMIWFAGKPITKQSVADRVARGLSLVPEDRQADGLFPNFSVSENLTLSSLGRLSTFGFINSRSCRKAVDTMIGRMGVKTASPELSIGALSGGNQQKVVIGRCLMPNPIVLLIDEPGRGVDIGARQDIFSHMRNLADAGMSVIFATSDMSEALKHADRILVMSGGRFTADLSPSDASESALVKAANAVTAPLPTEA
jgi:erythritol transport system ATP-binding protein